MFPEAAKHRAEADLQAQLRSTKFAESQLAFTSGHKANAHELSREVNGRFPRRFDDQCRVLRDGVLRDDVVQRNAEPTASLERTLLSNFLVCVRSGKAPKWCALFLRSGCILGSTPRLCQHTTPKFEGLARSVYGQAASAVHRVMSSVADSCLSVKYRRSSQVALSAPARYGLDANFIPSRDEFSGVCDVFGYCMYLSAHF